MTPQEKGDELISKYLDLQIHGLSTIAASNRAVQCSIIAVEEIIKAFELDDKHHKDCHNINSPTFRFYEQVLNYLKSK